MQKIFLSYRRADAPGYVGRLADGLEACFGAGSVFRDVDSLRAGDNWKKALAGAVSGAELVIAIIGPQWQTLLQQRSEPESDWVRFELNQARQLDIPVVPLVLGDAPYSPSELPTELAWLADIQGARLADGQGRWASDLDWLTRRIAELTTLKPLPGPKDSATGQVSHGDQSPNINSGGGAVTINFGATNGGDT